MSPALSRKSQERFSVLATCVLFFSFRHFLIKNNKNNNKHTAIYHTHQIVNSREMMRLSTIVQKFAFPFANSLIESRKTLSCVVRSRVACNLVDDNVSPLWFIQLSFYYCILGLPEYWSKCISQITKPQQALMKTRKQSMHSVSAVGFVQCPLDFFLRGVSSRYN